VKRALIGIGIAIAVIVVGIGLWLTLTDFSKYRPDIEEAVTEATGRALVIEGKFELEVFPPSIVAEGVSYANAEWGSDEPLFSIGHLSASIAPESLFSGPLSIRGFTLRDVTVLLEENEDGEANWSIDQQEDPIPPGVEIEASQEVPVILASAELENITIIRRRPGVDDRVVRLASMAVTTSDQNVIEAQGTGSIDGRAVSFSGNVGPVSNLESGNDLDVLLDADFGVIEALVSGNTGNTETLEGTALTVEVSSDELADVFALLEVESSVSGPLQLDLALGAEDGTPELTFNAAVAELTTEGSIRLTDDRYVFDVGLSALDRVGALLDVDGLPPGPASANGAMLVDGNQYGLIDVSVDTSGIDLTTSLNAIIEDERIVLDPFAFQFDESDVSGRLDIRTAEPVAIVGNVRSKLLDLTPYASREEETPVETEPAEPGEFVLGDEPLPFDFLNAGNVDLELLIERFRNGPLELQQVNGTVRLADGTLTVDGGLAVADGGEADATVTLVSSGESASLNMVFELADFRLRAAQGSEIRTEEIPLIGLSLDIESSGNSAHTLAANSNGKMILTQGPGKMDNRAMGLFSADIISELFSALNPFAKSEPYSNWECTVLGMDVIDGVATINPLLAQGERVMIVAVGNVDFNTEKLDISFNTKPRKGVGVTADMFLTPFVKLGGTLASPQLALDKSGILIEGGAAFLTGGISFLVKGAADRATGAQDRCAVALAIANGEAVEAAETAEN
jgi:uncharacterized protein involved in outer membrane biogenesis